MAKITQKDINDAVWKACDTFRGSIDPSVYKDYVLTMLFLKYLSDVHDDKMEGYLAKYNGDVERAKRAMQHERFVVPEHSHFKFLYDSRNEANIGELINIALADWKKPTVRNCTAKTVQEFSKTLTLTTANWVNLKIKTPD
ncbi:hypothetical protein EMGBS15_02830 [Filimonas sp.]|nr:hypothetical protein EMGBS15_02830 [Filimonas sp.]